MIPYADFAYFGLLCYVLVPTVIIGLLGWAGWRWAFGVTLAVLVIQYQAKLGIRVDLEIREIWIVLGFAFWEWMAVRTYAATGARGGLLFYFTIAACLLPLALAKAVPVCAPFSQFGFLGVSYVTFRVLDLVFCMRDKVIEAPTGIDSFAFVFFFPAVSAGPIDRYRRFAGDWRKSRTRAEFLADFDGAVHRIFRGFLYKFICAALIKHYWLDRAAVGASFGAVASYMYAYSFYLFFDFAGYSAFAIAFSYLLGVHTPENFDRPFLARNIRDFWNRWHITLSFWFRDHVYMRFLLAATRGRWIKSRQGTAIAGYYVSFGLMGLWHGIEPSYILYGLYHATLLSGFQLFSHWNKSVRFQNSRLWRGASIFVTFQLVCFGFLIFSGRLVRGPASNYSGVLERADCEDISGWVWNQREPNAEVSIDLLDRKEYVTTVLANNFRQDLSEAGKGNGRHGFHIGTPPQLRDGRPHLLFLRVAGAKKNLPLGPRKLICPEPGG